MKKKLSNIAGLVAELPDADRPGEESKFTGPPPQEAKRIASAILAGGEERVTELALMVRDAAGGGEENYKPGYALRCVALHVAGEERAKERSDFAKGLAAAIRSGKLSDGAAGFLVRELQAAGGDDALEVLAECLNEDAVRQDAVHALVAIGGDGARQVLRTALGAIGESSAAARLALIQALGALADGASREAFQSALGDDDREVRIVSAWALARTASGAGDGKLLVEAARKAEGWERIQLLKSARLVAESRAASGDTQGAEDVYDELREAGDSAESP